MSSKWTKDQQNAINATNGTILVSAAAGSGKTSVLVQRVINQITDLKNHTDIDKFLIVTFTNAAAQEMRVRILNRLSEMINQNPDSNLYRQQMMLKYASIGTIHSFCNNIVKENFFKLGISPKFRIADSGEIAILKDRAMENTLNFFYSLKTPEFKAVLNLFSSEKDDSKLSQIINQIYDFTRSIPFPEKWIDEKLRLYEQKNLSVINSPWGKIIITHSLEIFESAEKLILEIIELSNNIESFKLAYSSALEEDLEKIRSLKKSFGLLKWDNLCSKINSFTFAKFKPLKSENNETEKNIIASKRAFVKSEIEKLQKYFEFTEKEFAKNNQALHSINKTLFEITKHFANEVYSLKLAKNVADFNDLEHWALELLVEHTESGLKKSKIAEEITQRYKEIMVDEYQDINEIQDTILKMITRDNSNIFMVGDVKQSIYKFRQSMPKIFIEKKNSYPLYNSENISYPAKIILGQNFRSKEEIIDGINFIFKCLMSKKVGEINYNIEEALVCGASYPKFSKPDVNFKIIDTSDANEDDDILEAENIAETIIKIISEGYIIYENNKERPATYSDFCVLLRSSNAHAHVYVRELYKHGVPSWSETNEKFLGTKEISTIISILQVIDNPVQDIPLISALMSPIFGFSIDEISKIRKAEKDAPFYFALKKSVKQNADSKLTDFFKKINNYRQISRTISPDELIDHIYYDTDYPAICSAMPKGETKKANLALLVEYARKFENQYHKGISGFLNFIENTRRKNSDLTPASVSSETENTVKIMSIHKSKGLEFPICIVAGCSKKFNFETNSLIIHPELGIGMKLKNESGTVQYDNLVRQSISLQNRKEDISEELRILYVALTRAKQKLIIIASLKAPQKSIQKNLILAGNHKNISPNIVRASTSFTDWLFLCLAKSNLKNKLCELADIPNLVSEAENVDLNWDVEIVQTKNIKEKAENYEKNSVLASTFENSNKELAEKIKKRFNFEYPKKNLINLPLKISASQLAKSGEWGNYIAVSRPDFMLNQNLSSTDRGNAMHKFMCYADFKNIAKLSVNFEQDRLIKNGFLNKEENNALDTHAIEKFIECDLFDRIIKSQQLLREYRFSVKIPPSVLDENLIDFESKNFIVTQGALDCAFLENDEYIIVDYKTDKTNNVRELFDKYSKQLEIYKYALEQTKGTPVKELIIYSFYLNDFFQSL